MDDRACYAHEVEAIIAFKIRANEDHKKHTSSIYKLANAKRRATKAAARATKAAEAK